MSDFKTLCAGLLQVLKKEHEELNYNIRIVAEEFSGEDFVDDPLTCPTCLLIKICEEALNE